MPAKMSNVAVLGLLCILISPCFATSHAFVMSNKGEVWLVSDTLQTDTEFNYYLKRDFTSKFTVCKVAIKRGRIVFDAGYFNDASQFRGEVLALPPRDFDAESTAILKLMKQDGYDPPDVTIDPLLFAHQAGVIQVVNGTYSAYLIGLATDFKGSFSHYVKPPFTAGIPHGFGIVVEKEKQEAQTNDTLRTQISQQPEAELLRMLKEETSIRPNEVGPPFTVLVLHKNGTVSDFSNTPVCTIPSDARAVNEKRRKPFKATRSKPSSRSSAPN